MDEAGVERWLADYVEAWRSYDPAAIGALFSEDALYRYRPWEEPPTHVRGRDAIVASWLEDPDAPGSWSAEYVPSLVQGDRAVATGSSRYLAADGSVESEYYNVFFLAFDDDARCREFTEVYMKRPEPPAADSA